MIRGVNRYSVEIRSTGSPYFERAICFVRPEFTQTERSELHRAALEFMGRLEQEAEDKPESDTASNRKPTLRRRLLVILPLVVSGLTGAAAAFLICLLI